MKLILHSDQSHEKTAQLDSNLIRSLTGKRSPRLVYIPSTPDPRQRYFKEKARYYEKIGFTAVEYFDPEEEHSDEAVKNFFACDVVHLSGGEACAFMDRLRSTGIQEDLLRFVQRGGVLLGVSAGAMLMSKTFSAASLFGERGGTVGLGLFEFEIVPHVSEHFPRLDVLQSFAKKHHKTLYVLNDGDVVVISGKKLKTYGSPIKIEP
jgi:dipeptidase E